MPNPVGRPPAYSREIADAILARLAEGESLTAICRDEGMPARSTVALWVTHDVDGFSDRYANARNIGLDVMAEQVFEIADDARNDWIERENAKGGGTTIVLNTEAVARSRLRFDARRWYLSKLAPKRYGDRIEVESKVRKVDEMSEAEMRAELEALAAKGLVPSGDDFSDIA